MTSQGVRYVRSGQDFNQDSGVNMRYEMVSIWRLVKVVTLWNWRQEKVR